METLICMYYHVVEMHKFGVYCCFSYDYIFLKIAGIVFRLAISKIGGPSSQDSKLKILKSILLA